MRADLKRLCERLLEHDRGIVEIVQFGSSVYAPRYAKDVDLLIITRRAKDYVSYLDVANPEDAPFNVDVLVLEIGQPLRPGLLRSILGAFKLLYGSGKHLLDYVKSLDDPTFDEAKSSSRVAESLMKLALEAADPLDKDRLIREAFDALFHSARIASMVYLSTEVSKWGLVRRSLPEPYKSEFDDFIRILHLKYFYNGEYPKERVEEEFDSWLERVKGYVRGLESEVEKRRG